MTKENTYKGEKLKKSNDPKPIKRGKNANERVSEGGKKPKSKQSAAKPPRSAAKPSLGGTTAKDKSNAKPKPASGGQAARGVSSSKPKREKFPHFRYFLKSKHPALIVGEQPVEEYRYRKVMHSEKDGKRNNEKVEPNPDPKDNKPMYIGKRIRHDKKSNFENKVLPWKYPNKNNKKK